MAFIRRTLHNMASTKQDFLVFVYGTLKQNQPNYRVMLEKSNGIAKFVCPAKTVNKWPLVIASKYNIPYLLHKQNIGHQIHGEIYSVDKQMLDFLDEFEGHPTYYTRLETPVITEENVEYRPWVYFINKYKPNMLDLPMIDNYDNNGQHGLRYVESETLDNIDGI